MEFCYFVLNSCNSWHDVLSFILNRRSSECLIELFSSITPQHTQSMQLFTLQTIRLNVQLRFYLSFLRVWIDDSSYGKEIVTDMILIICYTHTVLLSILARKFAPNIAEW